MYLVCSDIQYQKKMGTLDSKVNYKYKGQWYYTPRLVPPPYLDRLWRLFILYNNNYAHFCMKTVKGYIDRNDVRENMQDSFEKYKLCREVMTQKSGMIKPFMNLWPEYKTVQEFSTDYEHTSFISSVVLPQLVQYMAMNASDHTNDQVMVQSCKALADACLEAYMIRLPGTPILTFNIIPDINLVATYVKPTLLGNPNVNPVNIATMAGSMQFPA